MKRPDPTKTITGLIIAVVLITGAAGYIAQNVQYEHLFSLYVKQAQQLEANGIKPTTPSPQKVAESGPAGAPGATGDQGDTGPAGPAGRALTPSEILNQIYSYCAVNNCSGPQGQTGSNGQDGTPGAPGASGAPGAAGPAGAPGTAGVDGLSGRGVTSVTCVFEPDLSTAFRFTFTDLSIQDVAGTCTPDPPKELP